MILKEGKPGWENWGLHELFKLSKMESKIFLKPVFYFFMSPFLSLVRTKPDTAEATSARQTGANLEELGGYSMRRTASRTGQRLPGWVSNLVLCWALPV